MFDSGIGGLTVLKAVMERLPNESLVYFCDTARLPYGTKSRQTVVRFSQEIVKFLLTKNPKVIVIACNTATAYALETIKDMVDIPVVGVIEPGADAAIRATRNNKVGVIGTRATIDSGAYVEAIQSRGPATKVFPKACPLLVPLIEEGWIDDPVTREITARYIRPLVDMGIDTLILGCTHYPLLKDVIRDLLGPEIQLVDSAEETASVVENLLAERGLLKPALRGARCEIIVSDMHLNLCIQASRFLGTDIPRITVVNSEFQEVKS